MFEQLFAKAGRRTAERSGEPMVSVGGHEIVVVVVVDKWKLSDAFVLGSAHARLAITSGVLCVGTRANNKRGVGVHLGSAHAPKVNIVMH